MKRDRFFGGDRHGSRDNGGGRRPTRRSNRMPEPGPEPEPEPEDEKTWNELERESEIAHYEKLGRSMQKGVLMEAEKQAPSAVPHTEDENIAQILEGHLSMMRSKVFAEKMVREDRETQQAIALSQMPIAVDVPQPLGRGEPEVSNGKMVALGVGAFVAGGVLGFLIGRSTR